MTRARDLLNEALEHAKILQEVSMIAQIKVQLGQIDYIEGNFKKSLETFMETYKLNRNVVLWQKISLGFISITKLKLGTVQSLLKLN